MIEKNRARLLWLLAAVAVAYAIANLILFYTTNTFGPVWFAASLLVYGSILVAALYLALVDTGAPRKEAGDEGATQDKQEPAPEPGPAVDVPSAAEAEQAAPGKTTLFDQEGTRVVRETHVDPDGPRSDYIVVTAAGDSTTIDEIEQAVDAASPPQAHAGAAPQAKSDAKAPEPQEAGQETADRAAVEKTPEAA